jgi:hypothetical protein
VLLCPLAFQIEVCANIARETGSDAWVPAGFSGHGFKFGAVIGRGDRSGAEQSTPGRGDHRLGRRAQG